MVAYVSSVINIVFNNKENTWKTMFYSLPHGPQIVWNVITTTTAAQNSSPQLGFIPLHDREVRDQKYISEHMDCCQIPWTTV